MKTALATVLLVLAGANAYAQDFDPRAAGCGPGDFASTLGHFNVGIRGSSYTPRCLKVKAGTTVTIAASPHHPLQGIGSRNPIFDESGGAESAKTVRFNEPGMYGYFCIAHGDSTGAGMSGAIWVE